MTTKSDAIMAEAVEVMPGGVSSPVRAFKSVGGNPVVFDHVKGSKAYDVDGNEYVDYVGTWGPAIVGHADDGVLAAITETMQKGTSFGAPCALENELAKMVTLPRPPTTTLTLAPGPKPSHDRVTLAPPSAGHRRGAGRRDGALHQLGHGGVHGRAPPHARVHRPREGH